MQKVKKITGRDNITVVKALIVVLLLVSVSTGLAESVLFDLCDAMHTDGNWNAVAYYSTGKHVPMAIDDAGRLTSVSYECTDSFASFNTSGDMPIIYPVNAGRDSFSLTTANNTAVIVIGGLNATESYDFKFFGSRYSSGPREIDVTIGGVTKTLETAVNKDQTVDFTGITADTSGDITINLALAASSSYTYLGVIEINGTFADAPDPEIYVAPDGNDSNIGTIDSPLATLAGAMAKVAAKKAAGLLPDEGFQYVYFREGVYCLDATEFITADSGTATCPIVYKSYPGETARLTGAVELDPMDLEVVLSGDVVYPRVNPDAYGELMKMSLGGSGVTDFGHILDNPSEIIYNGEILQLGRWPNESYELTVSPCDDTSFKYDGDRPATWTNAPDAWTEGHYLNAYFQAFVPIASIDTANKIITLTESPIGRGIIEDRPWYAVNLLEEIDIPGEYYIDRTNGILYIWPPAEPVESDMFLTSVGANNENLFELTSLSNVRFEDMVFEGSRSRMFKVIYCSNLMFDNCVFRNTAGTGLTFGASNDCIVKNSQFYDIGKGSLGVNNSGDRKELIGCGIEIINNYFTGTGRYKSGIEYTAGVGLHYTAVGVKVANNHFERTLDMALSPNGNNHIVEYNRFDNCAYDCHDLGPIYAIGYWSTLQGTVIRYNEIINTVSELPGEYGDWTGIRAIYFDYWSSGAEVYGNIIDTVDQRAFHNAGGRDNHFRNNVVVDTPLGIRVYRYVPDDYDEVLSDILQFDYHVPGSAWYNAFPELAKIPLTQPPPPNDQDFRWPINCELVGNLFYNVDELTDGNAVDYYTIEDNLEGVDPGFIDRANGVLALRDDSVAYSIPGFERIAWEQIGLLDEKVAINPIPVNGSTNQEQTLNLYWGKALDADSHKVYLGTNADAVASRLTATQLSGTTEASVASVALNSGRTYYWAVDEYDTSGDLIGEGSLWSFTTSGSISAVADFNIDYIVDHLDLEQMATHWLADCSTPSFCDETDLNNDGSVDKLDFVQFALAVQQDENDYLIDFETPDYFIGTLDGQDGWGGSDFYVTQSASSGLYQGGQTVGVSAHNIWANRTAADYKIPIDVSQGAIHIGIDLLVCEASGFHWGLRTGSPDYGPQFGYDTVNGETQFIVREISMGASYYGNSLQGRDGHWIRLVLIYDTVTGLADMTAYDLTVKENFDTGITGLDIGLWTTAEAGMFFRHLHRDQTKSAEVMFDNINVFVK